MSKKYYAVRKGWTPNIYTSWEECKKQIEGFSNMEFKGFELLSEAQEYMKGINYEKTVKQELSKSLFEGKKIPDIEEVFSKEENRPIKLPEQLTIYTDGSCYTALGQKIENTKVLSPGGYATVILGPDNKEIMRIVGGEQNTTNNRMEFRAVIAALKYVNDGTRHRINLITDSKLVTGIFQNRWIERWKKNAKVHLDEVILIKNDGKAAGNQELIKEIDRLRKNHDINFVWTKGHANDPFNELCDRLAKNESNEQAGMKNYKENQVKKEISKQKDKSIHIMRQKTMTR